MRPAAADDERSALPIADIDLAGVAEALVDNSGETMWWYNPRNGQVEMAVPDSYVMDTDVEDDPYERRLAPIEPLGSQDAYRDMVEFAESTTNPSASGRLRRALEGRGAFRRFRDTLYEFPDLRERWFEYSNAACERRAIDWLLDERCVDPDDAEAERQARSATMTAVLAVIGAPGVNAYDESQLSDRWADICDLIDDGRTVTIARDGRPWATISRHPTAPP